MVVYGHAGYFGWVPLVGGMATIGVLLFFFLSGFLMGHHYLPDASSGLLSKGAFNYWAAFLFRRFMRVYPPFVLAPILGYLLLMPRLPPDFTEVVQSHGVSIARALARLAAFRGRLGIYWTIEVELFFYLLYPFIIVLCLYWRHTAAALFLLFAALTLLKQQIPLPSQWPGFTSVFVAGVFTAVVAKNHRRFLDSRLTHANALTLASFLVLALTVALISQSGPTQKFIWGLDWLFSVLFFVMFTSLLRSDGIIGKALASRIGTALGRASYSLYLVHIIAFYIVLTEFGRPYQGMVAAVVVLSILTPLYHLLVERPFIRLGRKIIIGDRIGRPAPAGHG
jgi:peptidoglycan/LPS O-acetylase OafA/YrhL